MPEDTNNAYRMRSHKPWILRPPATEQELHLLVRKINGFPKALFNFLQQHDGGEGGIKNSDRIVDLGLWGVKDLSMFFDYKNEVKENWHGYLMVGRSGAGHELLVPLGQDDPPVYACDPLDDEPISEDIDLLYASFSELMANRTN